ncbi:MAG: GNAT family N-acetyltransferase [Planctomycetota bacterium]
MRLAGPSDAGRIVETILRCYGETYVEFEALDVPRLRHRLLRRETTYALAEEGGRIVGQVALERLNPGLFAHCRAVVDLEHRGRGLMSAMSAPLLDGVARELDAKLILGSSVTHHVLTQRYNLGAGFQPLGLLLGIYPGIRALGVPAAEQAVSGVQMGLRRCFRWSTREVALPRHHAARASKVLAALGIPCRRPRRRARVTAPLGLEVERHLPSGRAQLRFSAAGRERTAPARALEQELARGAQVLWADVPLAHPNAPALVLELEGLGLGYGAVVPLAGLAGEDVLRLQRCERPVSRDSIQVLPELEGLRDDVLAERARVQRRREVYA